MLNRLALIAPGLVGVYLLTMGVLYLAGFRVYRIPGKDMQPTIQPGEMVVGRLSEEYRARISRFELAVYTGSSFGTKEIYTKRVIGLPGESITINAHGVKINGQPLVLPPAVNLAGLGIKPCDTKIQPDAVFMLGDNTANSADSRYYGPTPKRDVIGYLVFKK